MIQRSPRLFIAEIQVPIFERVGLEVADAEADSGAGGIPSSCKVLNVGDIILAEAYPDEAAEECGEEWLRILEHRFRFCPSVLEDLDEDLAVDREAGSTDASESDDGDPSDQPSQFKVYRGAPKGGGLVLRRHRVMGTFLRPINKEELAQSKEEPAQEPHASKRELPEEAQIWPRDILERFLVTGERPRWTSDPGEGSLALAGPMSRIEVEEALRTAALWLSRADALLVLADGMAEKGPAWPRMKETGKTFEQMCTRASFLKEPQLAWECWLQHCQSYRESTPNAGYCSPVFQHTALGAFGRGPTEQHTNCGATLKNQQGCHTVLLSEHSAHRCHDKLSRAVLLSGCCDRFWAWVLMPLQPVTAGCCCESAMEALSECFKCTPALENRVAASCRVQLQGAAVRVVRALWGFGAGVAGGCRFGVLLSVCCLCAAWVLLSDGLRVGGAGCNYTLQPSESCVRLEACFLVLALLLENATAGCCCEGAVRACCKMPLHCTAVSPTAAGAFRPWALALLQGAAAGSCLRFGTCMRRCRVAVGRCWRVPLHGLAIRAPGALWTLVAGAAAGRCCKVLLSECCAFFGVGRLRPARCGYELAK
eukprot:s2125_g3.t1